MFYFTQDLTKQDDFAHLQLLKREMPRLEGKSAEAVPTSSAIHNVISFVSSACLHLIC